MEQTKTNPHEDGEWSGMRGGAEKNRIGGLRSFRRFLFLFFFVPSRLASRRALPLPLAISLCANI
jgi:hypothetical protein